MAEIIPTTTSTTASLVISNGERIRIVTMNSDGTLKAVLIDDVIPSGKALSGSVTYGGSIASV